MSQSNGIQLKALVPDCCRRIDFISHPLTTRFFVRFSVWAVTNNDRVGWRKGVEIDQSGESEDDAVGTNWVEMVGNIDFISATHNDQVLPIESDD